MRFVHVFVRLVLFALSSEELLSVERVGGGFLKDGYVVILEDGPGVTSMDSIVDSIPDSNITQTWTIMHGFTATLAEDDFNKLRTRRDISTISENAAVGTMEKQ